MKEQRKLAAIMFTDIVGYSALMSKDEKVALQILNKNRELQKATLSRYHGEFIKEIGDGVNVASRIQALCEPGGILISQTFDRELKDIFAIQDEIASAIVSTLKTRLLPEDKSLSEKSKRRTWKRMSSISKDVSIGI